MMDQVKGHSENDIAIEGRQQVENMSKIFSKLR